MTHDVALEVRGLTRRYKKLTAVDALDLTVNVGDVYGFLGPNGAGKTTAIRCILDLIRRDAGEVAIFGERVPHLARRHVGAIVETPAFHGWITGRDNLALSCAYAGLTGAAKQRELDRVLERVGLVERARDRAGTYSLGMKQRLGIARALIGQPRLLLLDEPTNGLDPRGMHEMREFIRSLAMVDGITVLISSHLLGEVQAICNRVGIIQKGQLRAEGTVKELVGTAANALLDVGASDVTALRAALDAIDGVNVLGPAENGRLRVHPGGMSAADLNRTLLAAGVSVDALVPLQRSLEDVFLEVTG